MINIIATTCIKNNDKLLLVQQNKEEYKELWDFPGGKVENGENIIQAAIRETLEETGYSIKIDNIIVMQNYVTEIGTMLIVYFHASLISDKQLEYKTNEIKNIKWFNISELKNMPKEFIRGGNGINKVIYNLEHNQTYPLDILEIIQNN